MKKFFTLLALASVLSASNQVQASVLYSDPLTAPPLNAGNLVGQDGWTAHSGGGSVPIQVGASGVTLVQGSGSREDASVAFTPISAGQTYYFGFDVVVTGGNSNAYFAHFKDVATDFTVRTFVAPSTNGGDFSFGLSPDGSSPTNTWATGLTFGQTYRVVGAYSADTRLNRLWVDPTSEVSTSLSAIDPVAAAVAAFALRQTAGNSTQLVSNLSVGTTWDSVMPNVGTNSPVVTSFDPVSGAAGTSVTIGGSNFTGVTNVAFSGVAATFSNFTDTSISASVPVGALTGPISVSTPNGVGSSTNNFFVPTVSVVLPVSINEGQTATGTVMLNGDVVSENVDVTLTSSSPGDLIVDSPVTISGGTSSEIFNVTAPLDGVIDSNIVVTVTPTLAGYASAPASITVINADVPMITLTSLTTNSYSQNFDVLGTATISNVISGTLGVQTSLGDVVNTNLNGWYGAKIGGSGTSANIVADNGSLSSGALYNYGSTNSPANLDRSLGGLSSGTMVPGFGALVQNNTGSTINSMIINLTGKFWRSSTSVQNVLTFGYGLVDGSTFNNLNFLSAPGASALPSANVVGPAPVASNGPLDGNDPANQTLITNVAIPVQLLPGETMFFRWQDSNNTGNDAGLAIDNLSLTASTSLPLPVVGSVSIDQFTLGQTNATASSSVISDSGSSLTSRGFVYAPTTVSTNPIIGGSGVTANTNDPAEVGDFTNSLTGLTANTFYSVRSFAVNGAGTNYSTAVAFSTLPVPPAFSGAYTQNFNGFTNMDTLPLGWRALSTSNINTYAGDWNATNSTSPGFYGRTNIPGVLGYLHTGSTGILSNTLTLVNNTGGTLTNLFVSYVGEVNVLGTNNTRFPSWTVIVDGQTNASLAYSTASGSNEFKSAEITGLSITNGGNIVVSWWSDRGTNASGSSRLIGMTDVRVATTAIPAAPVITSPSSAQGTNGVAFSYQITANNNPTSFGASNLPAGLSVNTNSGLISGTPTVTASVTVALSASNEGGTGTSTLSLNIVAASDSTFTSWAEGAPLNSANLELYAIGGATSPTATNGVPSQASLTSSNLSIIAIVRTNDPNLTVFGQATANLKDVPWATNGVTKTTAPDQLSVPSGTARQIFSIERGTNTSLFLRIDSILQP